MSMQRFSAGVTDSRNGKCILSSNRKRGARISPSYLAGYFHNTKSFVFITMYIYLFFHNILHQNLYFCTYQTFEIFIVNLA